MFLAQKKLSRQRKWQLKKKEEGLCTRCGNAPIFKREMCYSCYLKRNEVLVDTTSLKVSM